MVRSLRKASPPGLLPLTMGSVSVVGLNGGGAAGAATGGAGMLGGRAAAGDAAAGRPGGELIAMVVRGGRLRCGVGAVRGGGGADRDGAAPAGCPPAWPAG